MAFTTIQECFDRNQLALIKVALNHAGIPFRVLQENSLNMGDAYILGNNGALVQVHSEQLEDAKVVLLEQNLISEPSESFDSFGFLNDFDQTTARLPLFGQLDFSIRLVLIVFLLVAIPLIWYAVQQSI